MLTCRYFAECSLQLWQGKVDSVILDIFAKTIDGLQKYVHFSEVAANTLVLTKRRARFQSLVKWEPGPYPLPSSTTMDPVGIRSAILSAYVSRTSISALVR
jgi:hypothetical protein